MITPNLKAHMSPKDRVRAIAAEVETLPGWSLNDRTFHASLEANLHKFVQFSRVYQAIKAFYLNQGHSIEQWQAISVDSKKFNQVWRQSLRLPFDDVPPPKQWRSVLPFQSSI